MKTVEKCTCVEDFHQRVPKQNYMLASKLDAYERRIDGWLEGDCLLSLYADPNIGITIDARVLVNW